MLAPPLWETIMPGGKGVQANSDPSAGQGGHCAAVEMDQENWAKLCAEHKLDDSAASACQDYFQRQVEAAKGSFKPY